MEQEPPKIEFPCAYPIKVLARSSDDLTEVVGEVFERHAPGFDRASIAARASSKGTSSARWGDSVIMVLTACLSFRTEPSAWVNSMGPGNTVAWELNWGLA